MKKVFLSPETPGLRRILKESHGAFLAALRTRKPKAREIVGDEALSQAHDAYALIRSGQISLEWLEGFDTRYLVLSVREGR